MAHLGSEEMFKGSVEGTGWEGREMRRLEPRWEFQLYTVETGGAEQGVQQEQTHDQIAILFGRNRGHGYIILVRCSGTLFLMSFKYIS